MPELSVAADPSVWSLVPDPDAAPDSVEPWASALIAGRTPEQSADIALAAELALTARQIADGGLVLLLCEPASRLFASLTLIVADAPPAADAKTAEELAIALAPSAWQPATAEFTIDGRPGWRVSILTSVDEAESGVAGHVTEDSAGVLDLVRTTYVFSLGGRFAVAHLSPLAPVAAAAAMALTEQLLPTIEVSGLD